MKRFVFLLLLCPLGSWAQSSAAANAPEPAAPPPPAASATAHSYDSPLDQLHDKLALREDQQLYWRAFQNRIDAYVGLYLREKPAQAFASEIAPRQIGLLVDQLQNRLTALEDIELTAKDLYNHLDAPQQATANQLMMSALPAFVSGIRSADGPAQESRSPRGGRGEGGHSSRGGGGMGGGMGGSPSGGGGLGGGF